MRGPFGQTFIGIVIAGLLAGLLVVIIGPALPTISLRWPQTEADVNPPSKVAIPVVPEVTKPPVATAPETKAIPAPKGHNYGDPPKLTPDNAPEFIETGLTFGEGKSGQVKR